MSEKNPVVTFKSNADSDTSIQEEDSEVDVEPSNSLRLSQLNLKSSVLCPKTSSLNSQYLACEQLEAHHKMVNRAKVCVDTAPPKSLQSYIGQINKRRQEQNRTTSHSQSGSFLSSVSSSPHINQAVKTHSFQKDSKITQGTKITQKKRHISASPSQGSSVADKITWYLEAIENGVFPSDHGSVTKSNVPSLQSSFSNYSPASGTSSKKVIKGDIMDWHHDKFTHENRLFVPRLLLNNSAKSKLKDMRCYNPPRKHKGHVSLLSSELLMTQDDEVGARDDLGSSSHKNWLTDQAQRAQSRKQVKSQVFDPYSLRHVPSQDSAFHETATGRRTADSPLEVLTREEETKYLKFVSDVTEDILSKGVFTDRAIKRAFHFHMQMKHKYIDKEKMQQLLDQVLEDLCISNDDSKDTFDIEIPFSAMESSILPNTLHKTDELNNTSFGNNKDCDLTVKSSACASETDDINPLVPEETVDTSANLPEDPSALS